MKKQIRSTLMGVLAVSGYMAWAGDVTFTAKPTVTKARAGATIAFAVSTNTDVAIFIEDAHGEIIRHLAAGVLGTNAPAPFAKNSLTQELVWDGKADFGKPALSPSNGPAEGGPFQVRVALGLKVRYDKVAAGDQRGLSANTQSLATGPDGTLYLTANQSTGVQGGEELWPSIPRATTCAPCSPGPAVSPRIRCGDSLRLRWMAGRRRRLITIRGARRAAR
jgi:hypothetical protein